MNTEILFEEYRGDILECVHHGMVCIVDKNGIRMSVGDTQWNCYYRSCSKPIQALPIIMRRLDQKYNLTEEETAIFSGSHCADPVHVKVLESIMQKTGLKEEQMIMLPTYPGRPEEKERLLRAGMPPRKIYHNCSGKHLAMMLLARELGESVEQYWIRGSRTQEEILRILSMISDTPVQEIKIGVDGCGVPVYAVPFWAIAKSYLRLVCPELIENKELRAAVEKNVEILHAYPDMIGGAGDISTILTSDRDMLGKSGAQGVYTLGIRSLELGIVFKIMDGSQEEFASTVFHIFNQLRYDNETIQKAKKCYSDIIVNNNNEEAGFCKAVFSLKEK